MARGGCVVRKLRAPAAVGMGFGPTRRRNVRRGVGGSRGWLVGAGRPSFAYGHLRRREHRGWV